MNLKVNNLCNKLCKGELIDLHIDCDIQGSTGVIPLPKKNGKNPHFNQAL